MQRKIIMIMVIILLSNTSSGDVPVCHHTCNMSVDENRKSFLWSERQLSLNCFDFSLFRI